MPNKELIKTSNLSIRLDGKNILENINLIISEGQIITIIGPNGSGKTTLVRCILDLLKPTAGEIWIKDQLQIGYLPQKISINPSLPITVKDFLKLKIKNPIKQNLLDKIVEETNIHKILLSPLQKISGGELQRVLLAKALLKEPQLLILDEPNQGVDVNGQVEFYKLIEKLRREKNIASLIISHDLHLVMKNTDYVICLHNHICCEGTVSKIQEQDYLHKLFNSEALEHFAIYNHHHDHKH